MTETKKKRKLDKDTLFDSLSTVALAVLLTVSYHLLYTAITRGDFVNTLKTLSPIQQFELAKSGFDVTFDLLLAAVMLALGSSEKGKRIRGVTIVPFVLVLITLFCTILEKALGHDPSHPFVDGAALISFWIPNTYAVLMFVATAIVISRKEIP
jgi:hypothetical protein